MNRSYFYLLLLCLLAIITYLDRVCMSVAGPRIQDALHMGPERWGWVGTVFLIGYCIFEIPTGHWGDRIGARRVLTRIVLWWSLFTAITGTVSEYFLLLGVRFLFGAGEAGAFPLASVAISNWFAPAARGRAFGLFIMCSQLGGALSPLIVVPIQQAFGWRMSFFVFGCVGVVWSIVWYWKYRDKPAASGHNPARVATSWRPILSNPNLWVIMAIAFTYVYSLSFYQTWVHTYLVKGRHFTETDLSLSSLPYFFGAAANLLGGIACDWLAGVLGAKWSRRAIGIAGCLLAATSFALAIEATGQLAIILCLSFAYAGITFQQPVVFTACVDIGGTRAGVVTGLMNTAGQIGAAIGSVVFGYVVKATDNYNAPLFPMAALLVLGALLWFKVDVQSQSARQINAELAPVPL